MEKKYIIALVPCLVVLLTLTRIPVTVIKGEGTVQLPSMVQSVLGNFTFELSNFTVEFQTDNVTQCISVYYAYCDVRTSKVGNTTFSYIKLDISGCVLRGQFNLTLQNLSLVLNLKTTDEETRVSYVGTTSMVDFVLGRKAKV